MNKENSNLNNKMQPVTKISYDELAKRVSVLLRKDVNKILKEFSFKIKIENSIDLSKVFNTEVNQISNSFESYSKKVPKTLPFYLQSLNERANDFQEMLGYIKSYPLKSITNQLKDMYIKENLNYHHPNSFMYEISKSITNLVVDYSINFEEIMIDNLCDRELLRLNPSFYIKNQALQILNPHKYDTYKQLLYKGIKAYYLDFKEYVNVESNCFKLIEKFFLMLIHKMEMLDSKLNLESTIEIENKIDNGTIEFPDKIFKNQQAFLLFTEYAMTVDKPEDIGFLFRYMSEVDPLKLIDASETKFRGWFNEIPNQILFLNSPIKTLNRMGNTKTKETIYKLIKEKFFPNPTNENKAA